MIRGTTIIAIVILHLLLHGIDVGFGIVPAECAESKNPLCGTPGEKLYELGRDPPTDDKGFLGGSVGKVPGIGALATAWDAVQGVWSALSGAFTVNYAWLRGDAYLAGVLVFLLNASVGAVAASLLFNIAIQGISRR